MIALKSGVCNLRAASAGHEKSQHGAFTQLRDRLIWNQTVEKGHKPFGFA